MFALDWALLLFPPPAMILPPAKVLPSTFWLNSLPFVDIPPSPIADCEFFPKEWFPIRVSTGSLRLIGMPSTLDCCWPAILLVALLLELAFSLLTPIGLAPISVATLKALSSVISLVPLSVVLIPIKPWSKLRDSLYFTSSTILCKLVEKVNSVDTTIFSFESKAIPLLLINVASVACNGFSSCIFKVYPKYNSWKFPNTSSGSATLWLPIKTLSANSSSDFWLAISGIDSLNLLKV